MVLRAEAADVAKETRLRMSLRIAFEVLSALPVRRHFPARTVGPKLTTATVDPVNPELVSSVKADHAQIAFNCPACRFLTFAGSCCKRCLSLFT